MADKHEGLPVHGYKPQSAEAVKLVNGFKEYEERLLRMLDGMRETHTPQAIDQRWLAIARTGFEQAFMALNRSISQPGRVALPEDEAAALERRDLP